MTTRERRLALIQAWSLLRLDSPVALAPLIEALERSHLALFQEVATSQSTGLAALDSFDQCAAVSTRGGGTLHPIRGGAA